LFPEPPGPSRPANLIFMFLSLAKKYHWIQPDNQKIGKVEPKNTESKIGAPEPRANHTATFIPSEKKVYIIGGHGGVGYSRKSFNDVYSYDCTTQEWTKISAVGNPPKERGGHTASLMPDGIKILVYGGWSSITQHDSYYLFDTEKNEWVDLDAPHDMPRWNHCSVVVPALPEWKLFVFGGERGEFEEGSKRQFGRLDNSLAYMKIRPDMKANKFITVHPEDADQANSPLPRENSSMIYDRAEQRIIIFGGWSGNYLNDIWELNISSVTGPEYAIYSIVPSLGPYTGGTMIEVTGEGFTPSRAYKVQFSSGKSILDVAAVIISPEKLQCETPSFFEVGPKEADVRVLAERGDLTLTMAKFAYFLNTTPEKTIIFGPGILKNNSTKVPTSFFIQARDKNNKNRKSGKDKFQIKIYHEVVEEFMNEKEEMDKRIVKVEVPILDIKDYDNGQYKVTYEFKEEAVLHIDILTKNEEGKLFSCRGCPFEASFGHNEPEDNNSFYGKRMAENISSRIDRITKFNEETSKGLDTSSGQHETDIKSLLKIKENIMLVQQHKNQDMLELEVMEQALANLEVKKTQYAKKGEHEHCKNLIKAMEKLSDKSEVSDKEIAPFMKKQGEKTKSDIDSFENVLKRFFLELKKMDIYKYETGHESALAQIKTLEEEVADFTKKYDDYEYFSHMFALEEGPGGAKKNLEMITQEVEVLKALWEQIEACEKKFEEYLNTEWGNVKAIAMSDEIRALMKSLNAIKRVDKKTGTFRGGMQKLKSWEVFLSMINELKDEAMTVGEDEEDRHWDAFKALFEDFEVEDTMKLEMFWNFEMYKEAYREEINDITEKAKQERKIQKQLLEVEKRWVNSKFLRNPLKLKDSTIDLLKMSDDDVEKLEEDQLIITTISASKFHLHFEKEVKEWNTGLIAINETVSLLSEVQKTWSFLINLFLYSEEVKKELKKESEEFVDIDREVKKLLARSKVDDYSVILKFCTQEYDDDTVKAKLEQIAKDLAVCQKGLNNFISDKRKVFPRFYFLTMEELLDILANGNSPKLLFKEKNYMSKIVQAADKLEMVDLGGDRPTITTMNSSVGVEKVTFLGSDQTRTLKDKVEIYLQEILKVIINTMKENAVKTYEDFTQNLIMEAPKMGEPASEKKVKWIDSNYAQLCLLVSSSGWVKNTEVRFQKIQDGEVEAMADYLKIVICNLTALIKLVQGELSKAIRRKIMCLITMETHNRDIIDKLVQEKVRKAEEFQWQSQLKFYYEPKEKIFLCRIADACLKYSYEYLGNGARLVVTPLTDRIYVTATQALHLKMGCAPAGPAGTGKTETTKDLANAVAKACYVFNCSPEMNFESMGNIFKGLASSGCWGCFDEFNRLVPEVLSVCTVQFKAVTDGIRAGVTFFKIEGDECFLDPTCGAFITMNPGYLGRSELPEGLKALFRPITVVVPDLELICENILMAEGFVGAKDLARKFVTLYSLCRDLLSKAKHYDWGLRAIKSVLVVAGTFKRNEPNVSEDSLLFRALRDFNYPKIALVDFGIFNGLLGDLFPGLKIDRKVDEKFENIVKEVTRKEKFKDDPNFILKVIQLQELLEIRHCVFIMGNPGSGKTTTWKILGKAQTANDNKTTIIDIDPKVISTKELYGYTNLTTKEWKNGLMSHWMQYFSEELTDNKPKWIILDGDLDANWIESMNSVMDDNKLLTLANNGRIVVKDSMRLIFEIRDLNFATPATVSRAGILYINDDTGYQRTSYIDSWLKRMGYEETMNNALVEMFGRYIPPTVLFMLKKCKFVITTSFFGMTVSSCKLLQHYIEREKKFLYSTDEKEKLKGCNLVKLEHIFNLCIVWGFGGALTVKDNKDFRKEFSDWWKGEFNKPIKFPGKGQIFEYFVKLDETKCSFEEWKTLLATSEIIDYDGSIPMQNITVPIPETLSIREIARSLLLEGHPSLLIGLAGSGKTQMIKGMLKDVRKKFPDKYYFTLANFNYFTDADTLQKLLEAELMKQGTYYGPKKGAQIKLIYFIDDLNMPQLDDYNTQTAIALLRQHIDHSHWYDISKPTPILKEINNTQVIAAMNPTSGSFDVNPRYQRHFWICSVAFPESGSLTLIYETFLKGHFSKFKQNIQEIIMPLIKAAITLHEKVIGAFKKTAVNFHYEFNIRHLSNIFAGILQSNPVNFVDSEKIVKLWFHESERIYADRLIEHTHIKQYIDIAIDTVKKAFPRNAVLRHYQGEGAEPMIFCHFPQGYQGDKVYDSCSFLDTEKWVKEALSNHNDEKAAMNLVLFQDAIKHVCKITRIVSNSSGHALLVGVGGSGKQSLAKLSAYIKEYVVFSITVSQSYNLGDLKTDLLTLFEKCGWKDEYIMFLITDSHINKENFLVYINDLLSSGEVSDLYLEDEKLNIINNVRPKCKGANKGDSNDEVWAYYIDKVKECLHVCLCFSPMGEAFKTRARRFPALVNSTVIDWFQPWPVEALKDVSKQFLKEINLGEEAVRNAVIEFMPYSFDVVNQKAKEVFEKEKRYVYNTPKSFLELIKLFTNMLTEKRNKLEDEKLNYQMGLEKLIKTENDVQKLQEVLIKKQVEVDEKKAEADKVAEVVGKEKAIVEEENRKAKIKKDGCAKIKADVEKQKASCQADVEKLQPQVEAAMAGLKALKPDDFKEARGYNSPPPGVDQVFFCIQYMFAGVPGYTEGIELTKQKLPKNLDWGGTKKEVLSNPAELIKKLSSFKEVIDSNQVPDQNFKKVKEFFLNPNFTFEVLKDKSTAAGGVWKFVYNISKYYEEMCNMIPKQNQLKEAVSKLEAAVTELKEVEDLVAELNAKLAVKQKELDEATAKKDAAQAEADTCNRKLSLAQRLVSALGSEKKRWGDSIEDLKGKLGFLVGDVLMASGFISYAGPFSKIFRNQIITQKFFKFAEKHGIPMSKNLDPVSMLVDEATVAQWNNQGLPSDNVSVENGTILSNSERYPLMIDPQLQGITWIKEKLKEEELISMRQGSKNYIYTIERAIEDGVPVLLENLEENIETILMPVIARSVNKKNGKKFMQFSGKSLEVHPNFKLYMQTKLSNPNYPPEIQAEAVLINFTVTEVGLGDQLLAYVVGKERPDLAKKKKELIQQQNVFKISLKELELGLLEKLNKTKGDPTENIELIESLEKSKILATDISEKVIIAKDTEEKINSASEFYRPAAVRGALIFFLMNEMYKLSSFYMYSLESFINVISRAIDVVANRYKKEEEEKQKALNAENGKDNEKSQPNLAEKEPGEQNEDDPMSARKSALEIEIDAPVEEGSAKNNEVKEALSPRSVKKRVDELTESITFQSFSFVRRGLFEKHKLIFSTMLCLRILTNIKELKEDDAKNFIIPKKLTQSVNFPESETLKQYITEIQYKDCKALEYIEELNGLCDSLLSEHLNWKKWIGTERAEEEELPKAFNSCKPFYKLMLIKILRPDRVTYAIKGYLNAKMGEKYTEQPAFDMKEVYSESNNQSPIFFVLFPGVDPTPAVEEIGQTLGVSDAKGNFLNISMGQGQEEMALRKLAEAAEKGTWIFLQNVHLMINWVKDFEKKLEEVSPSAHANFRCFISSEPPPNDLPLMKVIPEAVLQRCIKVANEQPADLKANMRRAYAKFDQSRIDRSSKKNEYKSILFALCYFHAVVSGRKKFGAQGWSRVYNFNDGDLTICSDVLHNYLEKYEIVPYNDLIYIYGEIMYGGHITDNWDRRTNNTYLKKLITPELLNQTNLIPSDSKIFRIPDPNKSQYEDYRLLIEKLPDENPMMFGMHPNAEINFLTNQGDFTFKCIVDLIGESSGGGASDYQKLKDMVVKTRRELEQLPIDILTLKEKILEINNNGDPNPFQNVCLQECVQMNELLGVIVTTLIELELGLDGALNMTDQMDKLAGALNLNRVPASWAAFYMSKKPLESWLADLKRRCEQLKNWSVGLIQPRPLRLSYLFNPMSFLTAIMQVTARENLLPLDNMALVTKVTPFKDVNELLASEKKPVDKKKEEEDEEELEKKKNEGGAYVDGFFLEGADWETSGSGDGYLGEQKLKVLHPMLPIVKVISVPIEKKSWKGQYRCPVYYTTQRGPTFICLANLNMESEEESEEFKWILSGVAAILNDDN
jgi:dynein heavy chain